MFSIEDEHFCKHPLVYYWRAWRFFSKSRAWRSIDKNWVTELQACHAIWASILWHMLLFARVMIDFNVWLSRLYRCFAGGFGTKSSTLLVWLLVIFRKRETQWRHLLGEACPQPHDHHADIVWYPFQGVYTACSNIEIDHITSRMVN